jgi:hypothetical protein
VRDALVINVPLSDSADEVSDESVPGMLQEIDPSRSPVAVQDRYVYRLIIVGSLPYQ